MTAVSGPKPIPELYVRHFSRTGDDQDQPMTDEFANAHISSEDIIGQRLRAKASARWLTLDDIASEFFKESDNIQFDVYSVADGIAIPVTDKTPSWFRPSFRIVIALKVKSHFQALAASTPTPWMAFIVGSYRVTEASDHAFLQVISWNGNGFNFYQRDIPQDNSVSLWTYQGTSSDAFDKDKSYIGPFNGHVNGAPIMKELKSPWLHWNRSGGIVSCMTAEIKAALDKAGPWLTAQPGTYNFGDAPALQGRIESAVTQWNDVRAANDFHLPQSKGLKPQVNVQRWLSHLCLTTTVNILCAEQSEDDVLTIPWDFFFDKDLLQAMGFSAAAAGSGGVPISLPDYLSVATGASDSDMGLCLLQQITNDSVWATVAPEARVTLPRGTLGGGKETDSYDVTKFAKVVEGEGQDGQGYFTFLTGSLEDKTGATNMQNIGGGVKLLSSKAINALLALDFCNPVYSWRRSLLLQYAPAIGNLKASGTSYDVEEKWIANLRAAIHASMPGEPEYEFLALYDHDDAGETLRTRFNAYVKVVRKHAATRQGIEDYLELAEAKRRIYRPLPLDEFGLTLPYAVQGQGSRSIPPLEMNLNGQVVTMPDRGTRFFREWTKTLWTNDPQLIPAPENGVSGSSGAPIAPWLLPLKAGTIPPFVKGSEAALPPQTCPASGRKGHQAGACPMAGLNAQAVSVAKTPVWEDDIARLFTHPYWVSDDPSKQALVGQEWRNAMLFYGNKDETPSGTPPARQSFDLFTCHTVRENIVVIYQHLRSQSMPITDDPAELWPEAALEQLRLWANQGCREKQADPINPSNLIPPPVDPPVTFRIRKDIRSLTQAELDDYRSRLDDRLHPGVLGSKWQELCRLHGEWCLHYQEAFEFWHRAYLCHCEELLDVGIPYWNVCDINCADPDSPAAAIPQAFLDETYTHPVTGDIRPNPLKYALGLDGRSTSGQGIYVQRDPVLVQRDTSSEAWKTKVQYAQLYCKQTANALRTDRFSYAQNVTASGGMAYGTPWANIPTFLEDEPWEQYKYDVPAAPYVPNFDGFFEQVHDNWHGWIGSNGRSGFMGDMADNTTTAADPIFLSFHANIDRIMTTYLETHPQTIFTANFPLRPFVNTVRNGKPSAGTAVDYDEPRSYLYTTVGDMSKETRSLGYLYGPPIAGDDDICQAYRKTLSSPKPKIAPSGGTALSLKPHKDVTSLSVYPLIVFQDITCTDLSYSIECFIGRAHLGSLTRLGMGSAPKKTLSRCRKSGITRVISLDGVDKDLIKAVAKDGFNQVVTELHTGRVVPKDEWMYWPGFKGTFVYGYKPQ